jgi:hypothetical protein
MFMTDIYFKLLMQGHEHGVFNQKNVYSNRVLETAGLLAFLHCYGLLEQDV